MQFLCCIYDAAQLRVRNKSLYSSVHTGNWRAVAMIDNSNDHFSDEPCARHFVRCEKVLAAIETLEKPTLDDIVSTVNLPSRTVHAIFKRLEDQHRVVIERVNGRRHGYYEVADWGNLNKENIVSHICFKETGSQVMQDE